MLSASLIRRATWGLSEAFLTKILGEGSGPRNGQLR